MWQKDLKQIAYCKTIKYIIGIKQEEFEIQEFLQVQSLEFSLEHRFSSMSFVNEI